MRSEGGNQTLKGYRMPTVYEPLKIKGIACDQSKLKCFVDIFADKKRFVPACKYEVTTDWKEILPRRGAFGKGERVTNTVEEIRY